MIDSHKMAAPTTWFSVVSTQNAEIGGKQVCEDME
jgi:hypothetical protein